MSRRIPTPKIDCRSASDLLRQLREMVPHYTQEWSARDEDDPGVGLLKIFSSIAEGVIGRLNRAPERNFLSFLEMLGIRLLPATPSRAPVRFLVVSGTENEFLIPARTQVSAPPVGNRSEELPFETTKELWAIPAALTSLIAVDPEKDRIYKPPPGFLALELEATDFPALKLKAFSAADSKFLQLDPPGQVQEKDFLLIKPLEQPGASTTACVASTAQEEGQKGEYHVVSEVKGPLVTLAEPLIGNYEDGTQVTKLTKFELFEGKNFQEHILFLAHGEYLNLKAGAEVKLLVEHAEGTTSNLQRLEIAWEFFGELDKVEGWHAFEKRSDETQGFSHDGHVTLRIPGNEKTEIKETEVNGNKSRWIRARLTEPIPATAAQSLPLLEAIKLAVSRVKDENAPTGSNNQGIPADQAFHNDTPLDVNLPFNPFGPEPRPLDRFYIASAEAFSKPGAEVTLNIDLSSSDLLSSPVAVVQGGKLRVFVQGVAGRLWEFKIDPAAAAGQNVSTVDHQTPTGVRLAVGSVPAVVEDSTGGRIGVFVTGIDGQVYLRLVQDNTPSKWVPLQSPPNGKVQFNPAAVLLPDNTWRVFVVADGKISSRDVSTADPPGTRDWEPMNNEFIADSTPFAIGPESGTDKPRLIVIDRVFKEKDDPADGRAYWHDGINWQKVLSDENDATQYHGDKSARPFGLLFESGDKKQVHVYLRNKDGKLAIFDTEGANRHHPKLTSPTDVKLISDPFVIKTGTEATEITRIYAVGGKNQLWELDFADLDSIKDTDWKLLDKPEGFDLTGDPAAISYTPVPQQETRVSVFSATNKSVLWEFRVPEDVQTGKLKAGPRELILLDLNDKLLPNETYFARITSGPGSNSSESAVRKIISPSNKINPAELEKSLDEVTTGETKYELYKLIEGDNILGADNKEVTLKVGTSATAGDFVFVNGQLREIASLDAQNPNLAKLKRKWNPIPTGTPHYDLLRLEQVEKNALPGCDLRAVLVPDGTEKPSAANDFYAEILITGPGANPMQIDSYDDETVSIVLKKAFDPIPARDAAYKIKIGKWNIRRFPDLTELRPELSWEYWNGSGWMALRVKDETFNLLFEGDITFTLPEDIAKTEVAGQGNFWIRARLVGGDYGREQFVKSPGGGDELIISKDAIRPPLINKLTIFYNMEKEEEKDPQFCLTFNNLDYLNQTAANTTRDKNYFPFLALPVEQKALYFGFNKEFEGGPVRLYFAARELVVNERNRPRLSWTFTSNNEWKAIIAEDKTEAFTKPEFVTWTVPVGFQRRQYFGEALFWIRATLAEREKSWEESPLLSGVFLNTVETIQARTISNEILGSGVGTKNERFHFQQLPVLEGEDVRVREALTDEERKQLVLTEGEDAVFEVRDQEGNVLETWVRWKEVEEFFDSGPRSRDYRLDRASGEVEFGNGVRGRTLPPGGDNVRAFSYQAGGGTQGNVAAGEINAPVTAVSGIESVKNPVSAGGGSDKATEEEMLEIGPAQVSNRGRAVTPDDFEWLAMEASREVRKVRCVPNRNPAGQNEVGWVSVYLVPDSQEAQPKPSLELRRAVQRYLVARADVTLVGQEQLSVSAPTNCPPRRVRLGDDEVHIFVGSPQYVPVNVTVTVYAKSLDVVGTAELKVKKRIAEFLHPLSGGPENEGWEFGRDLAASDLYLLLEEIEEVDHVGSLLLVSGKTESEEQIAVGPDALLASGVHTVTLLVANGE
jgi:Baseplate J-like protein